MVQDTVTALGSESHGTVAEFVALVLAGLLAHEGGHVLGYRLTGHPWRAMTLKFGASVSAEGPFTPAQTLMASALGPLLEALFGAAIVLCCPLFSMAWLAGLWVAASGVLNLVVPVTWNSDATKIFDALGRMLRAQCARNA